ncbi:MAG: hypothetical protein D6795_04445 [Deltaproteobacteria bacterium]|nr:MAG: hypothetical protein D6795_04445 [Deltaproteobacteria bacterium]
MKRFVQRLTIFGGIGVFLTLLLAPSLCTGPCDDLIIPVDPAALLPFTIEGNFDTPNVEDLEAPPPGIANIVIRFSEEAWLDLNGTEALGFNGILDDGTPVFVLTMGELSEGGDVVQIIILKEADLDGDGRVESVVNEQNPEKSPVGLGRSVGAAFWYPDGGFFEDPPATPVASIGGTLRYCEVDSGRNGVQRGTFHADIPSRDFPPIDVEQIEVNEGYSIFDSIVFSQDDTVDFGLSASVMRISELGDMVMNLDAQRCATEGVGCTVALASLDERAGTISLFLGDFQDETAPVALVEMDVDAIYYGRSLFLDGSEGKLFGWTASADLANGQNPRYETCDGAVSFDPIGAGREVGERLSGVIEAHLLGPYNDCDRDGIGDDGDDPGQIRGDHPCRNGDTERCDDNCPTRFNPDQADENRNGVGDVCEP